MKNLLKGIVKSNTAKKVESKTVRLPICEMHDSLLHQGAYSKK
jgi:hypothetical protein